MLCPEGRSYLNLISNSCPRCLEQIAWAYEQELGKVYVKMDQFQHGDMGRYGIVAKVLSPQTVLIKLKGDGKIERAIGQTIPLVPKCILKKIVCFRL